MRNLRLDLCYDGTRYRGWQRLPGHDDTIQGKIEQTVSRILNEDIQIHGSGRTDAGVHALHQIASFHCSSQMSADEILTALRQYLPEDIGVYSCKDVSERFHARLNAVGKKYCYRIWNSSSPCVFDRRYCVQIQEKLNTDSMRCAAACLTGTHDFAAFCTRTSSKKSTIRTITDISIIHTGTEIRIEYTGDGFLYNMVRILTGTLIEVGSGKREAESISNLFCGHRENTGFLAPAKGLCLMEVFY